MFGRWLRSSGKAKVPLLDTLLWRMVRQRWAMAGGAPKRLTVMMDSTVAVLSGVAAVAEGATASRVAVADVTMRRLDTASIEAYVATGESLDKAGGYGIQGVGAIFVERVEGDYFAVVGLSVAALVEILPEVGWEYRIGSIARLGTPSGGTP